MIQHPAAIAAVLLAVEGTVLYLAGHSRTERFFKFLPHIFWIYFLPMVLSTFGIIDPKCPFYGQVTQWVLPMSLLVLLMTVDVPSIIRLGPMALGMFIIGSVSVGFGMVASFAMFKGVVGVDYWSGFGALTGSWTGGSANMIAVKEALSAPDNVFLPLVVVDAVLPYLWMACLIALSQHQHDFDRWNGARRDITADLEQKAHHAKANVMPVRFTFHGGLAIIAIGIAGTFFADAAAKALPAVQGVISPFTWVIVFVSFIGLFLSATPLKKLEGHGSNKIGYFLLYFVLTTIGAKANLNQMSQAFVLMAAGTVVIAIHALFLFLALRLFKAPLFLAAAASQANLGGVASAPVVAEVYHKGLAPLGLLLAIAGNIIGTYIGIAVGQICRLLP